MLSRRALVARVRYPRPARRRVAQCHRRSRSVRHVAVLRTERRVGQRRHDEQMSEQVVEWSLQPWPQAPRTPEHRTESHQQEVSLGDIQQAGAAHLLLEPGDSPTCRCLPFPEPRENHLAGWPSTSACKALVLRSVSGVVVLQNLWNFAIVCTIPCQLRVHSSEVAGENGVPSRNHESGPLPVLVLFTCPLEALAAMAYSVASW